MTTPRTLAAALVTALFLAPATASTIQQDVDDAFDQIAAGVAEALLKYVALDRQD